MAQLITTADDYGMCSTVNDAIDACLAAGALKSTCVMANMPETATAAKLRETFNGISVGLHWNITQGWPLLDPALVPTLVDDKGSFLDLRTLRHCLLLGQVNFEELAAEMAEQYKRCATLIGQPDFWNVHENAHLYPRIFDVFVTTARELGIPRMRSNCRLPVFQNGDATKWHLSNAPYWMKGALIAAWSERAKAGGMVMPAGLVHLMGKGTPKPDIRDLTQRLRVALGGRIGEYVIHPATLVQEELFGNLTDSRLFDYELFSNPELDAALQSAGIELVGFKAL